ncbi:hypothetical protein EY796_18570, partial [Salmonella enterica subsp. enterica serovar Heidelberg]
GGERSGGREKTLTAEISRLRGGDRAGVLIMNKQRIFVAGHRGCRGPRPVRRCSPIVAGRGRPGSLR